jgi:hypothetical protein
MKIGGYFQCPACGESAIGAVSKSGRKEFVKLDRAHVEFLRLFDPPADDDGNAGGRVMAAEPPSPRLALLERAKAMGLTFGDCVGAFKAEDTDPYLVYAQENMRRDGATEIDDEAVVSHSDDGGAYVMAWVWVDDRDIWTGEVDSDGKPCRCVNHYEHLECERVEEGDEPPAWTMQWSSECNDQCPYCDAEIEPCATTYLGLDGKPEPEAKINDG